MRRRLWLLVIVVPLLAVVADALAWQLVAGQLRSGLADWIAAQRATGWVVNAGPPQTGGWPLAATITVRNFALTGGAAEIPGGLAWRADAVVLRLDLLHPSRLVLRAEGQQQLRLADGPDIPFTAGRLQALLPLQAGTPYPVTIRADALRAMVPLPTAPASPMTIDRVAAQIGIRPAPVEGEAALTVALTATGIGLPPAMHWALGPAMGSLALDAALNGNPPPVPGLAARATAWRDEGGSLEIQRLETHWGPLDLNATATLALDPQLQPMGAGTAQVTGYAETLDALAAHGLISRSAATAAKAVLSLLARTPDDGGPSEVDVPLSLQYRTLSMRQVPLVRLPELDWPGP
jgi:hypothetical protein